jgi:hypothetical protein
MAAFFPNEMGRNIPAKTTSEIFLRAISFLKPQHSTPGHRGKTAKTLHPDHVSDEKTRRGVLATLSCWGDAGAGVGSAGNSSQPAAVQNGWKEVASGDFANGPSESGFCCNFEAQWIVSTVSPIVIDRNFLALLDVTQGPIFLDLPADIFVVGIGLVGMVVKRTEAQRQSDLIFGGGVFKNIMIKEFAVLAFKHFLCGYNQQRDPFKNGICRYQHRREDSSTFVTGAFDLNHRRRDK